MKTLSIYAVKKNLCSEQKHVVVLHIYIYKVCAKSVALDFRLVYLKKTLCAIRVQMKFKYIFLSYRL